MNNKKTNLLAFNLIEMIVTMSIVAILTGVGITKFNQLKTPKEIIDETTNIILTAINQTVYKSLNNKTLDNTIISQDLCSIQAGTGANRAGCNTTLTNNSWNNINNTAFNNLLVTVQFNATNGKFISKITYKQGLTSTITYTDNTNLDINNTTDENIINPITIVVRSANPTNCYNEIKLWPNNVTSVDKHCDI